VSVDAIGSVLATQDPNVGTNSQINQADFIKLFVSELRFQDPLQPLDNGQFLAELAQFVGIEQQQRAVDGLNNLLSLGSSGQSLGLLNHAIQFGSLDGQTTSVGKVSAIEFDAGGASLSVTTASGVVTGVRMSQIQQVTP
jgi:flagellar basal-body rod modification protein FlgD